jgi:hypothetical protein
MPASFMFIVTGVVAIASGEVGLERPAVVGSLQESEDSPAAKADEAAGASGRRRLLMVMLLVVATRRR